MKWEGLGRSKLLIKRTSKPLGLVVTLRRVGGGERPSPRGARLREAGLPGEGSQKQDQMGRGGALSPAPHSGSPWVFAVRSEQQPAVRPSILTKVRGEKPCAQASSPKRYRSP